MFIVCINAMHLYMGGEMNPTFSVLIKKKQCRELFCLSKLTQL